jgi:hypothetical protein
LQARFRGIDDVDALVDGLNQIIEKNHKSQPTTTGTDDKI